MDISTSDRERVTELEGLLIEEQQARHAAGTEAALAIARVAVLRSVLAPLVDRWCPHSSACCLYDEQCRVVVTEESCRCDDTVKRARAALADTDEAARALLARAQEASDLSRLTAERDGARAERNHLGEELVAARAERDAAIARAAAATAEAAALREMIAREVAARDEDAMEVAQDYSEDDQDTDGYKAFLCARAQTHEAKAIATMAGSIDGPGRALAEEVVRLPGPHDPTGPGEVRRAIERLRERAEKAEAALTKSCDTRRVEEHYTNRYIKFLHAAEKQRDEARARVDVLTRALAGVRHLWGTQCGPEVDAARAALTSAGNLVPLGWENTRGVLTLHERACPACAAATADEVKP